MELLAIQEVKDTAAFTQMLSTMDGYEGFYGNWYFIACAFIYNTDHVSINSSEELFYGDFSTFPRPPLLIDLTYNGVDYIVINNHFKCCDGSEDRRLEASRQLKDYIDVNLSTSNVIVVGDFNDLLVDNTNVFEDFISDGANYLFSDMSIAEGPSSAWSYPSWPSHLDHILITDELFYATPDAQVLALDEYYASNYYDTNISDHRPVGIQVSLSPISSVADVEDAFTLNVYPTPVVEDLTVELPYFENGAVLRVINSAGRICFTQTVVTSLNQVILSVSDLPSGTFFIELQTMDKIYRNKLLK